MSKEAEVYYRLILSEPLDESTFKQTLQNIYDLENAASLITENFMTILNNPNINVFRFIFDDFFCDLFSDAIKKNISIVLRMIVKSGNPALLDRLENHHRGLLMPKVMLVLVDNPKFDSFLERLKFIFSDELFENYGEEILKMITEIDPKEDYEENKCRLKNLINLISNMPIRTIEANIDIIEKMLENMIRIAIEKNIIYHTLDAVEIMEGMSTISKKDARLKRLFERNLEIYISFLTECSITELKKQGLLMFLEILLKEILKEQNASITDAIIRNGHAALAFIIGDRVLKIQNHEIDLIPYDPCLLRPLIRIDIKSLKGAFMFGIELCDRVKTDNLDKNEIYRMFKDALSRGILLGDCHHNNAGILLKNNTPHLEGAYRIDAQGNEIAYDVDDEDISIDNPYSTHTVLSAGSYVLLDYCEFVYSLKNYSIDERIETFRYSLSKSEILKEIKKDLFSRGIETVNDEYLKRYISEKIDETPKRFFNIQTIISKM